MRDLFLTLLAAGAVAGGLLPGRAVPVTSITFDGSLGPSGALSPTSPGLYSISPSMGKTFGPNLFQSFGTFNLGTGDTALFEANAGTQNIIARVTGGSPSSIDGHIESQAPNLFFLNPAGVMFGANAQVYVTGAFTVSTANYVKFNDGGIFYAQLGGATDNLTSAPVSAFGFLTSTPQPVTFSGAFLFAPNFNVISGDITLTQTGIYAPGNLTLFSAASAGEVPFNLASPGTGFAQATNTAFGHIILQNGSVASINNTTGGGKLVIRGGRIVAQDSSAISALNIGGPNAGGTISIQTDSLSVTGHSVVESDTSGAGAAGNINISATGAVTINSAGSILSNTEGAGMAGNVVLQANTVVIDGSATPGIATGIASITQNSATGSGGQVSVTVTGLLDIESEGTISTDTYSQGSAGDVNVLAGSIKIDGSIAPQFITGIFSDAKPGSSGPGGTVRVTATDDLDIFGGGNISAGTFSSGHAGDVFVTAGNLVIDGSSTPDGITGINADNNASGTGAGGNVTVEVSGGILITSGGFIEANTGSSANAGSVTVHAGSVDLIGSTAVEHVTGIFSQSNSTNPANTGNAGTVDLDVIGALTIEAGAGIQTNTSSAGNAGDISVHAGSLTIDGTNAGFDFTGISSNSGSFDVPSSGTGASGVVTVRVDGALQILDGGGIGSDTFSAGPAGSLIISAGSLTIDGTAAGLELTGISSTSSSENPNVTAKAGSIAITVSGDATLVGGGEILTNTSTKGNAGDISLTAASLSVDGGEAPGFTGILSLALSGSTGNGGSIVADVAGALALRDGAVISATTFAAGHGGDATVNAGSILLDGSVTPGVFTGISSDADVGATGASGSAHVTATGAIVIMGGAEISASTFSSGNAGEVVVHGGSLLISGFTDQFGFTGIASNGGLGSSGNAGNITVDIDGQVTLINGGRITSNAQATGNAGTIDFHSGSLTIDGTYGIDFASITSQTTADDASNFAHAGSINVDVDRSIVLRGSGNISTSTSTSGNAGDVTVRAGSILINGSTTPDYLTGIASSAGSDDPTAVGNGGNVIVLVRGSLDLQAGAGIDVRTFTAGQGGSIVAQAGSITVDGSGVPAGHGTGFIAQAFGTGNSGSVSLKTGSLDLTNRGEITSASVASNGGNISVTSQNVRLTNNGRILTNAQIDGGNIDLNIGGLLYLFDASISTKSEHNGGNITIGVDPQFVVLDHSLISANAVNQGGNITIESRDFLNNLSDITATGAQNGVITITSPDLDLSGSLLPLPAVLVSDEERLRENCARSIKHEFSSLIAVGRGGTETAPEELSPDFGGMDDPLPSP